MAQTRIGFIKKAAKQIGISPEAYIKFSESGLKRCTKCKAWKPIEQYDHDKSRGDGLAVACKACRRVPLKRKRIPMENYHVVQRAHDAVRHAIKGGQLQKPTDLVCRCGKPARQYHHHFGYEGHELDVVALCMSCHGKARYYGDAT